MINSLKYNSNSVTKKQVVNSSCFNFFYSLRERKATQQDPHAVLHPVLSGPDYEHVHIQLAQKTVGMRTQDHA